nr:MAG TPA_asm: hypothetical protein [Caudoviricetes sp.]
MSDLTKSVVSRQNILNNQYAMYEVEKQLNLNGINFNDEIIYTKEQLSSLFEVDVRTIERYLESNKEELNRNGYRILRGEELRRLKEYLNFDSDINVGVKVQMLGVFSFRALLNMAMLISESSRAKEIRGTILDIVIDVINKKVGGNTKYINQRDEEFLNSWFSEENYRKEFTNALDKYVDMGPVKYGIYTNRVYEHIFKENAAEYKNILRLKSKDRIRDTLYSEVLDLVASYEVGLAYEMKLESERIGRKLRQSEVDKVFKIFHEHPSRRPLLNKARNKMASRDLAFRDALHIQLENYITPVEKDDYERFIGEKSKELKERLEEAEDVFKRLKEY